MRQVRHAYTKPENTQAFLLFTCHAYLSFQSPTLLFHKCIANKPFTFLHPVIKHDFFTISVNS